MPAIIRTVRRAALIHHGDPYARRSPSRRLSWRFGYHSFAFALGVACLAVANRSLAKDSYSLRDGALMLGSRVVLQQIPAGYTLVSDPTGAGVFLRLTVPSATARICCGLTASITTSASATALVLSAAALTP